MDIFENVGLKIDARPVVILLFINLEILKMEEKHVKFILSDARMCAKEGHLPSVLETYNSKTRTQYICKHR